MRNESKRLNQLMADTIQIDKNQRINQYQENISKYSQIINSVENSLQFKKVTLDKFIQDDPYVLKMVDEGKLKAQSIGVPLINPNKVQNH